MGPAHNRPLPAALTSYAMRDSTVAFFLGNDTVRLTPRVSVPGAFPRLISPAQRRRVEIKVFPHHRVGWGCRYTCWRLRPEGGHCSHPRPRGPRCGPCPTAPAHPHTNGRLTPWATTPALTLHTRQQPRLMARRTTLPAPPAAASSGPAVLSAQRCTYNAPTTSPRHPPPLPIPDLVPSKPSALSAVLHLLISSPGQQLRGRGGC